MQGRFHWLQGLKDTRAARVPRALVRRLRRLGALADPSRPRCNLCGSDSFLTYKGRPGERCAQCNSKLRHRIAYATYIAEGVLPGRGKARRGTRVLHIAPERRLHRKLKKALGTGYVCADAVPEEYPWAACLRLFLPQDLAMFPDGYFDHVIHNHVLEHVPGSYKDHIHAFCRVIKPGGRMVFSVPGPDMTQLTEEGGEFLESDAARKAKFGQYNHLKQFGRDLPEFLASLDGSFRWDGVDANTRRRLGAPGPKSNRMLIWEKSARAGAGDGPGAAGADREITDPVRAGIRRRRKPAAKAPGPH